MNTPQRSLDYSSDKETLKTPVNQRFRQITTSPAPSPIRRYLSSTLNDFREKGNKELGRIYETFSELTGISPIPKERSQKTLKTITKRTSKSTLDADQILNEHKNHTFLTPIMERHSVRDSIKQDIGTQTPLAVEEDHNFSSRNIFNEETSFYNNTFSIPPQKISEPTSINHTRQDSDDNQLEKSIDHSKKSSFSFDSRSIEHQTPQPPQEDNRASRLVEMLMAENVRLERLQKNLDYILLQTSELAKSPRTPFPSSENRLYESELVLQRANTREHYCRSPSTSLALPINELKKYSEVAESPRNLLDNTPSSFYRQFHSSPISATHSSSVPTPSPALPSQKPPPPPSPPPPPPPPPVQTVSSQNAPFVQTSKASDKSQQDKNAREKHSEPSSPHGLTAGLLKDIPKARLKSARIIVSPSGRRVSNRFWKEIHKDKLNKRVLPEDNISSPAHKRQRTDPELPIDIDDERLPEEAKMSEENDDEDDFWKSDGGSSAFNDRLFRVAQEEREESHKNSQSPRTPSTLGYELEMANDAALQSSQKRLQEDVRVASFSLQKVQQPEDPERNSVMLTELKKKFKEKQNLWRIQGDEWRFSGTSYITKETRKK